MFGDPPNPFSTGALMSQSPGVLRKNGQNTMGVVVPKSDRNAREVRACQASGSSSVSVGSDTPLVLDVLLQDTLETPEAAWLATLASNTLTFKRSGYYLITYSATFGYDTALGTLGATMKQAKISAQVKAGGQAITASKAWTTLSSRLNVTNYVKIPDDAEDGIIFYHGTHTSSLVSTPDSDEPSEWHGSATVQGTWTVWAFEEETGDNLQITGAPILTNLTPVEEYQSSLFDVQTVNGSCLVEVVATKADEFKVRIADTLYAGTVKVEASVTYGGEGTVDPVAVCTACTLTILRI